MPPCARSDEAGPADTSATRAPRRAASSAAAEPASPSPMTRMSVRIEPRRSEFMSELHHPLDGAACAVGNVLWHGDLEHVVTQRDEQLLERDLLHVAADGALARSVEAALRRLLGQAMHDAKLGRDDEASGWVLLRVLHHPFRAQDVGAVRVDVAARLEVHALAGAATFGVNKQVGVAVVCASLVDVGGPD